MRVGIKGHLNRLGNWTPLWLWYWWFCFLVWLGWDYQQVDRQHQGWLLRGREILCYSEASRFVSTFLPRHCTEEPGDKSKTSHNQLKNSTQYLISVVSLLIVATGDNHLLVQVSSSKTTHRPGKKLLCTEQHLWKVHTSRCICKFCSGTLTVVLLQFDDGLIIITNIAMIFIIAAMLSLKADYNCNSCNLTNE